MKKLKVITLTLCFNIVLSITALGQNFMSQYWHSNFTVKPIKQETDTWCLHACNAMLGVARCPGFKYDNQRASVAAYLFSLGIPCSNQPPTYFDPLTLEEAARYGGVRFGDIKDFLKFKKLGLLEKCYVGNDPSTYNNYLPAVLVDVHSGGGHAMILCEAKESYRSDSFKDSNRILEIKVCDPWTGNMKTMIYYSGQFDYELDMYETYYVFYNF